ncbi:MAG: hypothetical protein E7544_05020 [Ruminococcaceae bacterium]|nr:hypothetical protein [Oscillospiraceae bacterium]
MKKTMKKLSALTLVFMLLFSVFSVQASAASIFDKIASVEVVAEPIVTAREIDEYIAIVDEYGWDDESDYLYPVDAVFEVTLTSGEVIVTESFDYGENADGKRWISAGSYIDIRDYQTAKENGGDTIPFIFEMYLYSSIDIEMDYREGTGEAKLIDCHIESLTPVSGLPDTYRDVGMIGSVMGQFLPDMEGFDLEGAVFDIKYPDGSVVRDTVEIAVDEDGQEYTVLNGEEIWWYFDDEESAVIINFVDASYSHPVEFIPFPVSEIVIDEVKVTDAFEAESVSYTVTKPDGTTQSYTYSFDSEPVTTILGMDGYMAESVDGAYVVILVSKYYNDDYPATEILQVTVVADIDAIATEEIEGATQEDNLLNRLIYRLRMFFMRIIDFLWYFY